MILVIEDQEDNRQILWDLLTSADFEVIEAVDGEAGLAAAAAHRPDLILMDIQLPVMDGYEATRRLKADAVLHAIPVIAVTSYGLAGDADKARAAGCDGYISKPYSPRQLLAKVREYLSSVPPTRWSNQAMRRPFAAVNCFRTTPASSSMEAERPLPCSRRRAGGEGIHTHLPGAVR
jgi:two-component system, cell cycle response regulator DivK